MELIIDMALLSMLVMTAIAIVRIKDMFAVAMLAGIYSLISASFFVMMDAVDVAITEAAVGAGISTILMLTTLAITGRFEKADKKSRVRFALPLVLLTGGLLIYGTLDMPSFGAADSPVQQHVATRYLNDSADEIGIPNVVTSVLASYRAFDTLGEVIVVFTAGIGVLALLMRTDLPPLANAKSTASMHEHMVLRIVAKILIPFILLFGLYVQFHGEYGPGGGFQAGLIFASAFFLYAMLYGMNAARRVIDSTLVQLLAALGVLIFGTTGVVSMISGKNFLDYSVLANDAIQAQHLGILFIEIGVGLTVAAVMIIIFFTFSGRSQVEGESD